MIHGLSNHVNTAINLIFLRKITMINEDLLDILVCPKCKGPVTLTETNDGLVCPACKLEYEIRDEIPIMLIEEAKKLDD